LSRSTHRYAPRREPFDEQLLLRLLQRFVADHPRYGYRRFWAQLQQQGVNISLKTTYRLWRQHHSRLGNGRSV
jgi:transposase InsO family protein